MMGIIRLSALGDIIHTAAIVNPLLKRNIDFSFITDSVFKDILSYANFKIIDFPLKNKNFKEIFNTIRQTNLDITIDMQGLLKSAILSKLISKNSIGCDSYHTKEKVALIFYNAKLKIRNHSIFRYVDMLNQTLNLDIDYEEIINHQPYLNFNSKDFIAKHLFSQNKKNIIFIIGASSKYKMYPKEKWINIANSLKENILIPYGNDLEKEIALYISKNSKYVNVLPKMNLSELKATLSNADLIIGNDTGPTYIGWANNIKNIIIYGPVEANKVVENKYTKFIKAKTNTNPNRINKNDFSIRNISEKEILNAIDNF